jgi:hypothetical protein
LRNEAAQRGAHRKGVDGGDARMESGTEEGLQWLEPARRTPGQWGKRVRRSGVDERDKQHGRGGINKRWWLPFKGGSGDSREGGGSGGRDNRERGGPASCSMILVAKFSEFIALFYSSIHT